MPRSRRLTSGFLAIALTAATSALAVPATEGTPLAVAPVALDLAPVRTEIVAGIAALRVKQALGGITVEERLTRAAQAHADAMAAEGWFGFESPAGKSIEDWVVETGYDAVLTTEKLVRSNDRLANILATWEKNPEANRQSLFHPEVIEIGVGIASTGKERIYAVALARPDLSQGGRKVPAEAVAALADLAAARAAYLESANRERAARKLSPFVADPMLDSAAQEHAEALAEAARRGRKSSTVGALTERIVERERHKTVTSSETTTGGNMIWQRPTSVQPRASKYGSGALGQAIVLDALSAGEAVTTALRLDEAPDLLDPAFVRLGVGIVARTFDDGTTRTYWVTALLQH